MYTSLRPGLSISSWCGHAVLRNIIREERGRAGFQREMPDDGDGFPASGPDALARLIEKEGQRIFRDCFENLSVDYRTVLTLRARGLKYSETAGRMGINQNTVATWISRATRRLGELGRLRTVRHTV